MKYRVPLAKCLPLAGAALLAHLASGSLSTAAAQLRPPADTPIELAALPTAARASDGAARTPYALVPSIPAEFPGETLLPAWRLPESRASLVEMPTSVALGSPVRRHYAFGLRSDTFRSWLADVGLDAQQCMAPIVRMSTRLNANGDFRGAFWVYVRCSLR